MPEVKTEYITLAEAAKRLSISISTLHQTSIICILVVLYTCRINLVCFYGGDKGVVLRFVNNHKEANFDYYNNHICS